MTAYYRPIISGAVPKAERLAGGHAFFDRAERLTRDESEIVPPQDVPASVMARLTTPRTPICNVAMTAPALMGIINVTPDSFSDGGLFHEAEAGVAQGRALIEEGAAFLDIGGESTRPGSEEVAASDQLARVMPVIEELSNTHAVLSIDTRSAAVAEAALRRGIDGRRGASLFNDVSALQHDPASLIVAAAHAEAVCLMHSPADPKTMQEEARYDSVLLDVYDALATRIAACEAAGIARSRIIVDPGIGFGKTLNHNLALIRGISLFHGLGCALLVGVSRKRFIGTLSGVELAGDRVLGSVAAGLACVRQGVQILRVHDVAAHRQALGVWQAIEGFD